MFVLLHNLPVVGTLVVVIITVSSAIIVIRTIMWVVTPVVVPEIVIIVPISVEVSGCIIAPLVPLIIRCV